MVKLLLLLPAVLVLAYFPVSAGSPAPQKTSATAQKTSTTTEKSGEVPARVKQIYKIDCAMCHGDTGDGKTDLAKDMSLTLSDFNDPRTFEGKSDQQIFEMIRKGKDKMPPEDAPRATDEQTRGLVQYIRTFAKEHPAPPAAAPATAPETTPAPAPAAPTTN
ncbi:MAG TPA: cytochrome c [Terracidiphilus sp.]|jgi:mono/diheme cytochrome c family protein|nr:cytochrome c [Terracidiphilus sp.]